MIRRPCWCIKQKQNVALVLHDNRVKFPKDFFVIVQYTNMVAMTWDNAHLSNLARLTPDDFTHQLGANLLGTMTIKNRQESQVQLFLAGLSIVFSSSN